MNTQRARYESFSAMPKALQDFLVSSDFSKAEQELVTIYKLSSDQASFMGDTMMDAVFGDLALQEAISTIKQAFVPAVVTAEKWKQFISDLLKYEAWPLRDVFGDELNRVMSDEGVSTASWSPFRVLVRPLTYSGAANEVALQSGFNFMGPQMRERMRDLIMSKFKGVRIDAQVKEVLLRPGDFGGLGLDEAMATRAVKAMNEIIEKVPIMSEDEYAEYLAEQARINTETEQAVQEQSSIGVSDEDAEIQQIKAQMSNIPQVPASALDEAIEKIWTSFVEKPTDEYLVKRVKNIISSRLRDVRSQLELSQLLERDIKVGGLGLERGAADRMAQKIEEGYRSYRGPVMEEEKKKLDAQLENQKQKVEERRKREAEEHAKWYQEKIGAKQQEEARQKQVAESYKKQMSASSTSHASATLMELKEQKREKERFGEMVPLAAHGAEIKISAPTVHIEAQTQASSSSSVTAVEMKPRMEDIRSGPKLVGLLQELHDMTLADFRRLAKDPSQTVGKILEKLETLGGEAFEKRIAGIQAWQQSPLQLQYVSLVGEAFRSGKTMVQLIEEKRKAGIDAPTSEEMAAIISLNGRLHF